MSFFLSVVALVLATLAFFRGSDLKNRFNNLEEAFLAFSKKTPLKQASIQGGPKPIQTQEAQAPKKASPQEPNALIEWLKQDWLMKVGAFFFLLAIGWFVRYAFINNWVGPYGRIAMGLMAGTAIFAWGAWLQKKRSLQGQVLIVTGATTLLTTVFAARTVYGFFTPESAMGIMVLVVAALSILSVVQRAFPLSMAALFGGAIAPLLADAPVPNYFILMIYIAVLALGMLGIVAFRGWRILILFSFIISNLYATASFEHLSQYQIYLFMGVLYAIFFVATTLAIWRSKKAESLDLFINALLALLTLFWVNEYIPEIWRSLVLSGVVIISALMTALCVRKGLVREAVYLYGASASVFLAAALNYELNGEALTIALTLESFSLTFLSNRWLKDRMATLITSCTLIVPLFMALSEMPFDYFDEKFYVILIVMLFFGATTWLFYTNKFSKTFTLIHAAVTNALAALILWWSLEIVIIGEDFAHSTALILFALEGIVLLSQSFQKNNPTLRIFGLSIIGLVIARLLLIDVWAMPLSGRIMTFFAVGALFVSTAFFKKNLITPKK